MENDFDAIKMNEVPQEFKKRFEQVKTVLENFKKRVLKDHKEVIGICMIPSLKQPEPFGMGMGVPAMPGVPGQQQQREKEDKDSINIFVLVDDSAVDRKNLIDFIENIDRNVVKLGKEVNEKIRTTTLAVSELKEQCFDGKYELLRMISMGFCVYDIKEMLAAIRIAEVHRGMVIRKFDKYIVSYVAAGSLFRGDKISNDIDVYVIVDDTDVKRMGRFELKDKLRAIIIGQGFDASKITGVKKQFHVQTYILTDFWESMKDANPVIFTLLRDGVPLYDRGVFMPWKLLLEMGRVKPSPEAIDVQMDIGDKLLVRTRQKLLSVVGEDLYYAMLNPAQAALMLYGLNPPTPNETIHLLREVFVKKEKLLEERYVKALEEIRKYYKDIEHGKIKEVSGSEIDRLLKGAEGYLNKLNSIFAKIEKRIDKKTLNELQESLVRVVKDIAAEFNVKPERDAKKLLKKLVDNGDVPKAWHETFIGITGRDSNKLSRSENQKTRREARSLINQFTELLQVKRNLKNAKNRIKVKYMDKYAEVLLFHDKIFFIMDVNAEEKDIQKADFSKDGGLNNIEKSDIVELEDYLLSHAADRPAIKGQFFDELKKIFGERIEVSFS